MKDPFEIYTSYKGKSERSFLSWEEAAIDEDSKVEGFSERVVGKNKIFQFWFLLFVMIAVFFGRLFFLQIIKGEEYFELSEINRTKKQTILAPRGQIKDYRGEMLADNTASYQLVAIPYFFPTEGKERIIMELASTFSLDEAQIQKTLQKNIYRPLDPVIIKSNLPEQEALLFESRAKDFTGFFVQKIPIRKYSDAEAVSHLLGYTSSISEEELIKVNRSDYALNDFLGKTGIEIQYEQFLHGVNGESRIETEASGKLLRQLGEVEPQPGKTLYLNIDKELQVFLYQQFSQRGARTKGAAVAMDPKSGRVLALVSVPGFDSNKFAQGISSADYAKLLDDKNLPLFNRAISGQYPPGSTVKMMVAAAGLEEKRVDENTIITDKGVLVIPNQYDHTKNYNFFGWKREGLGQMNAVSAISQSSDIYFYILAGGHPSSPVQGLGADLLAEYYRKFGLGKVTGIDIPGEKTGLVPDPKWKAEYYKNDPILSRWYLGNTYHIGIGQGDLLSTPLQVAVWTSFFANRGVAYKPFLLNRVEDKDGRVIVKTEPRILIDKFLNDNTVRIIQKGMRENVLSGSGRQLASLNITSAGKTGTSQFDGSDPKRTHAWFTSYAPFENPEIVITVLVEAGGEGHAAAVPIVKNALAWWAENRYGK